MKDRRERYLAERAAYFRQVLGMGRRDFLKASGVAAAVAAATGKLSPHSFQPVDVVQADTGKSFTFAYVSDT
ncbi:MAG TPA: twin-arginine translocation signal domain-containing protein, partial [Vicinamibacteria bacterium]|nr:twin-arginine translocation signal domain-containing protein [Vicinamibacteria bacterium]